MEKILIDIVGMSCQKCVKSITDILQALPGVERVDVSLEAAQADISYDPAQIAVARLRDAVEDAGFDIS